MGARIHIRPNHPIYPKEFPASFLNLPVHLQEKILGEIWNDAEGFHGVNIYKGCPRLRVDLIFLFMVYSLHKAKTFPLNKFGYGCKNGRQYTAFEACFNYSPFDLCATPEGFRTKCIFCGGNHAVQGCWNMKQQKVVNQLISLSLAFGNKNKMDQGLILIIILRGISIVDQYH